MVDRKCDEVDIPLIVDNSSVGAHEDFESELWGMQSSCGFATPIALRQSDVLKEGSPEIKVLSG